MSRIGKLPIAVPTSVTVSLTETTVSIKGPKGELSQQLHPAVKIVQTETGLEVKKSTDTRISQSLYGTYQRLLSNMVQGVTSGFEKQLELVGTGYRAAKQGSKLVFSLGFSHPVEVVAPAGIEFAVEGNTKVTIKGIDKQMVGQVAANIRALRPPEPYKGKGIRYSDEVVRRKAGKAAKAGA